MQQQLLKMHQHFPIRVWLTTTIVGSLLFVGIDDHFPISKGLRNSPSDFAIIWAVITLISLIISLLAFGIFYVCCNEMAEETLSTATVKRRLGLIGSVMALASFRIFDFGHLPFSKWGTWITPGIYIVVLVFSIAVFKLRELVNFNENVPPADNVDA